MCSIGCNKCMDKCTENHNVTINSQLHCNHLVSKITHNMNIPSSSAMETVVLTPNGNPVTSLPVTDTLNVSVVSSTMASLMMVMLELEELKKPLVNVAVNGSGTT